ncbi:hypothetical protein OE88DRAFT_1739016 [Heliocybe sulcata]|uniref:Uncharacterized protein n=1 Tax=Heliocybe sulcata TaxID=5364 RepID=A0A5C3MZP0_9AGAM|nr:hypothetical protein OE88DRAFT_1739016 [Heliocybe sulcata]
MSILPLANEESDAHLLETAQPCPAPWTAMVRLSAVLHDDLRPSQLSSGCVIPAVLDSSRCSERLDRSLDNIEEGLDGWSPNLFGSKWDDDVEEPKQEANDVQEGQSLSGTTEKGEEGAISPMSEVPDLVVTLADADSDEHP